MVKFARKAVAKKSVETRVAERVRAGRCLVCDATAEVRGLCNRHYRLFMKRVAERPTQKERQQFLEDAIRAGLVLDGYRVRELRAVDPFAELG